LVERASGFAMLVAVPDGYKPEHVAPGARPRGADGIDVFFCDPRALAALTKHHGLLRHYFPCGTQRRGASISRLGGSITPTTLE
jgi:hypothetical protein